MEKRVLEVSMLKHKPIVKHKTQFASPYSVGSPFHRIKMRKIILYLNRSVQIESGIRINNGEEGP